MLVRMRMRIRFGSTCSRVLGMFFTRNRYALQLNMLRRKISTGG